MMAFLNVQQISEKFGLTPATVRSLAKRGELPGVRRIGGRWFCAEDQLRRYFETAAGPGAAR